MAHLFARPIVLITKLSNRSENLALFLKIKNNYFNEKGKKLSQATAVLLKDSRIGSGNCSDSSPCSPSSNNNNPCKPRIGSSCGSGAAPMKNSCDNTPKTTKKPCEEISTISQTDPCYSDCQKSENLSSSNSSLNDPCPPDCRLSRISQCPEPPPREKTCPEPPPPIDEPTEEDGKKARFWRNISIFGGLPVVILSGIIIHARAAEEATKPRPKYVPMDYMYRRTKRFPWGDGNHSFFHNPIKNAVPPDGYEVDDPNEIISK